MVPGGDPGGGTVLKSPLTTNEVPSCPNTVTGTTIVAVGFRFAATAPSDLQLLPVPTSVMLAAPQLVGVRRVMISTSDALTLAVNASSPAAAAGGFTAHCQLHRPRGRTFGYKERVRD